MRCSWNFIKSHEHIMNLHQISSNLMKLSFMLMIIPWDFIKFDEIIMEVNDNFIELHEYLMKPHGDLMKMGDDFKIFHGKPWWIDESSSILYGVQQVSTGNQLVGFLRSQGAPGSWPRFLSEPGPQAVLLRICKVSEQVACVWFSFNFH